MMRNELMTQRQPFDDLRELIAALPAGDDAAASAAHETTARGATFGGAGQLASLAEWLARFSARAKPQVSKPMIAVFAGAHGIANHGVSADNDQATAGFLGHASSGSGLLARLCAASNIGLKVLDLAVDLPVPDVTTKPALDERDCAATMAFGMEAVAGGHDLLCLAGLGAGGLTAARILLAAVLGGTGEEWAAPAPPHRRLREIETIDAALRARAATDGDPLDLMRRFAGREIAAMAGAMLAARMERVPVVLDGVQALAAACTLRAIRSDATDHCMIAHGLTDPVLARCVSTLGLANLGALDEGASPGVASTIAVAVLRAACVAADEGL